MERNKENSKYYKIVILVFILLFTTWQKEVDILSTLLLTRIRNEKRTTRQSVIRIELRELSRSM